MLLTRSTQDVAPTEQLEYWHSLVKDIFADVSFQCKKTVPDSFNGYLKTFYSGPFDIYELATEAHQVHRDKENSTEPAIILTMQISGEGYISQDGRQDKLEPGDFTLLDSSRPFDLQFEDSIIQSVMRFPWRSVKQQLISPLRITGKTIKGSTGAGHIASNFIRSFAHEAPTLQRAEAERLSSLLIDIVNTAALSTIGQDSLKSSDYCAFQTHQVRLFIEDNLRNPDLSPTMIAAAHGISPRYLNKLFESENISISRLIWDRRLDKCHEDLLDSHYSGKSITDIAFSWGFKSSSHFSRTFKERFGISPREIKIAKG